MCGEHPLSFVVSFLTETVLTRHYIYTLYSTIYISLTLVSIWFGVLDVGGELGEDVHPCCVGLGMPGAELRVPESKNTTRRCEYMAL